MKDAEFLKLFSGNGRRKLEKNLELRTVPAFAVLQARREAMEACGDDAAALGLWVNACLLARAVYQDGKRVFSDGGAVLGTVSAETLERWMESYAALCRDQNPACSEENAQRAVESLETESYERLKWRVLRAFGVLPSETRAKRMTDRDYLYCAAQMMLDEEEKLDAMCPVCREQAQRRTCLVCGAEMPEQNAGFDEGRFEELRNAGIRETAFSDTDEACGAV